jgi:hypothetical protein
MFPFYAHTLYPLIMIVVLYINNFVLLRCVIHQKRHPVLETFGGKTIVAANSEPPWLDNISARYDTTNLLQI